METSSTVHPPHVLVLNAGSSSLKFALIDPATGKRPLSGLGERLGSPVASIRLSRDGAAAETTVGAGGTHSDVVARVLHAAADSGMELEAVGHRVVHGGEQFTESTVIDDEVVAAIERFRELAPLHNPAALLGIEAVRRHLPGATQVAVFDTAFHQTLPPYAYRYAVPTQWYTDYGVRRYGFHGISHRYVSGQAATVLGRPAEKLALVVAHLGNGCSATAVLSGRSVDTTMGLTPLEGLVMGTRSGDIDAGVFSYLDRVAGLTSHDVTDLLNGRSGLLGLSDLSNDMRTLIEAADGGHAGARLAIAVFVHRLAKAIAGLVVSLGRLDALVFTGGIGENSPIVRAKVIGALGLLGLRLDADANTANGRATSGRITTTDSAIALVIATDEELLIARDAARLIRP